MPTPLQPTPNSAQGRPGGWGFVNDALTVSGAGLAVLERAAHAAPRAATGEMQPVEINRRGEYLSQQEIDQPKLQSKPPRSTPEQSAPSKQLAAPATAS